MSTSLPHRPRSVQAHEVRAAMGVFRTDEMHLLLLEAFEFNSSEVLRELGLNEYRREKLFDRALRSWRTDISFKKEYRRLVARVNKIQEQQ